MSYDDPFADAPPAEDEAQVEVKPAAVVNNVAQSEGKVVVTLKGGRDFDAPWIVIHAESVADATQQLQEGETLKKLMGLANSAAKFFSGGSPGGSPNQNAAPTPKAPQGAQAAPGGEKRFCEHGEMVFKSGVSAKTGKPYKLFSCTAPRQEQCKAQFLD